MQTSNYQWQALRLFNLYRVILALGFCALFVFDIDISFLGVFETSLYEKSTLTYLLLSVFFLLLSLRNQKYYAWQANGPIFIDIISIVVIMHASGGMITGIGILLIVIVAAHSLLVPGKLSFFSAALATLSLLVEQSYTVLILNNPINVYSQVGFLGVVIFATSFVTNLLAQRARKTQIIVESQAQLLATSQQLNAYIVSAMHAGVLVLDEKYHIRLINLAAKKLLGIDHDKILTDIKDLPTLFSEYVKNYLQQGKTYPPAQMYVNGPEVRLNFHLLGQHQSSIGTLIFIYNVQEETRQAQDLKLASLGHLTANIAHELRNPLGAASHAAQLLAESQNLTEDDFHLVRMIKDSCDRMNVVIQNVLSLSGRKASKIQRINLIPWLKQFIKELVIPHIPHPIVTLDYSNEDITIQADPSQLTQILIILCENGLRYSLRKTQKATITLRVNTKANDGVYLDIIDQGEGVSENVAKHIFEPFFTTEQTGSGLGLYIAKELSEMNGARLSHQPIIDGYQFRLTIPNQEDAWHNQQPW
ncbi:MAG: hypothetical protein JSR17_10695 [Proteobacteria bacterium]|nr:hypothetical protein [Pseudomonadota bacterium]